MDEMIYCVSSDCPYKGCNKSAHQFDGDPDKRKSISTANLQGICAKYVYWVANEAEKKK